MTDTSLSSTFVRQKDGTWDDWDPIRGFPASGSEYANQNAEPSNDTPTDLQMTLESCGRLMLSLRVDAVQDHRQILALEKSMQQVIQQLRTPLNGARPINRLPPEILSTIFRLAAGPIKTTDLRDVLRLSSICRHWRSIVLDHGAMWSSIRLTGQDPSFVTQQVERCQGVPLHLFINLPPLVFRIEGAPFHARFKQVAPIIRARRCQVQSISAVIGGCRAFRRDLGLDWPNLEELVWVDTCPAGSRMHERNPPVLDKDHRLPKLRRLSAKQGLGWEMTSVVSLTALKLEGPMDINLLKFLQATPHLGSMELIKFHIHPLPVGATSIDLPRLTRLVMRNVDYGQLFVRITFLSLKILSVDQVGYQEPVEIIWGKLQVPQTITAVKIEYLETGPDKISINGSNETKTHSLSLTERAALTRSAPMIQALSHTSLTSVTSLSIGRGAPELGVQLPSTSICALISKLPRLWRLDLFPSQFTLKAVEYLRGHPLVCPELRILSLTVVRETCEKAFHLLAGLVTDRAKSERWLNRMDCVILRAGGDPRETCDLWDSMSQACKLEKYLRCNGGEEDTCSRAPVAEMYPTEKATFKRHSYRQHRQYTAEKCYPGMDGQV